MVTTGSGRVDNGMNNTEIIDLSKKCSISFPHYPKILFGTTGQFLEDAAIICGGKPATNECFALGKKGLSFEIIDPMKEARYFAESIVTQGRIWVVGGVDINGIPLSSTEYIPKISNSEPPNLPEPVQFFSIISINETTSMLIGGANQHRSHSAKTVYFNHQTNLWKDGPRLINGRRYHAAGVVTDHVTHKQHIAVVGGETLNGPKDTDDVELLFNGETQWKKGTFDTHCGKVN